MRASFWNFDVSIAVIKNKIRTSFKSLFQRKQERDG